MDDGGKGIVHLFDASMACLSTAWSQLNLRAFQLTDASELRTRNPYPIVSSPCKSTLFVVGYLVADPTVVQRPGRVYCGLEPRVNIRLKK